jgi:hypothetical protein
METSEIVNLSVKELVNSEYIMLGDTECILKNTAKVLSYYWMEVKNLPNKKTLQKQIWSDYKNGLK